MPTDRQLDDAISRWLEAEAATGLPDHVLRATFERTRKTRQERGWRALLGREHVNRLVLGLSGAAVVVVAAALTLSVTANRGDVGAVPTPRPTASPSLATPTPAPTVSASPAPVGGLLPAEQADVIARQVAALNSRDAEAFVELFADDPFAGFDPRGSFEASSSLFSNSLLAIADRDLIEAYMAINEAWRFEAEVVACYQITQAESDSRYWRWSESADLYGHCEVKSRWPALSLEIREWWFYEFRGTEILWWDQHIRDTTPTDRTLALGLDGLLEWESWLESTDPQAAARLLNPREFVLDVSCGGDDQPPCMWSTEDVTAERIASTLVSSRGQHDWVIAGERFSPNALVPHDPALADELEASIQEYLGR